MENMFPFMAFNTRTQNAIRIAALFSSLYKSTFFKINRSDGVHWNSIPITTTLQFVYDSETI